MSRFRASGSCRAAVFALSCFLGPGADAGCHEGALLTLLHFNDFHGQLEAEPGKDGAPPTGGIARLAAAVAKIRTSEPQHATLLLFAGDLLQGTVTSSLFQGVPDVTIFGRLGVDAAAVGNHEFDYGQDVFMRLAQRADFPFLAANLRAAAEPLSVKASVLVSRDEMKIAVIGLTTPELTTATHPRNVAGIEVEDPVEVAARLVPGLREESDLLVVLSHLGLSEDKRLARSVQGIDLIVGGHNHHVLRRPEMESGVPIVQAGERGRWLGRMDMVCRDGRLKDAGYELMAMDQSVTPEPELAEEVRRIVASAESGLTEVVGETPVELSADRHVIRRQEALLGDFVADVAREETGADVALFNGGSFRASIPAGAVTLKGVYQTFPFRNELVLGRLTGAQLMEVLRQSAALNPEDNPGGFLQVAGLRYRIRGRDLGAVSIGGAPLDLGKRYRVVVPDFLAAGGDGYGVLARMEDQVMTGRLISDMLIDAFRNGSKVRPKLDGRIFRDGD